MADRWSKQVAAHFVGVREIACDASALAFHALLLGAFALLCTGVLPAAVFVPLGFCLYIRNFNSLHAGSHARRSKYNPLRPLRRVAMVVHGPLQLGRDELVKNHRLHHAYPGDPERDPDSVINDGVWWRAALNASVQPEITFMAYVRRVGFGPSLRNAVIYNSLMSAALVALAGADIVWWILVTRMGSTACWFAFDWCLHHPRLWSERPLEMPRPVMWAWSMLFSRANLEATRHHVLHHRYPFVGDRELPELAHMLAAEA